MNSFTAKNAILIFLIFHFIHTFNRNKLWTGVRAVLTAHGAHSAYITGLEDKSTVFEQGYVNVVSYIALLWVFFFSCQLL